MKILLKGILIIGFILAQFGFIANDTESNTVHAEGLPFEH